ncbi:MAG TPA: hypothetical protein VK631_15890 [Solirubrobacteraceae bacterium]|nr:hypothetical protein [Solirubrobacteraceae bacterium]
MRPYGELPPTVRAGAVLYRAGIELAGQRLRLFVADLLEEAELRADVPDEELVERAVWGLEDGPVSLVAIEPELRDAPLDGPASSVSDAAVSALRSLGLRLLVALVTPPSIERAP